MDRDGLPMQPKDTQNRSFGDAITTSGPARTFSTHLCRPSLTGRHIRKHPQRMRQAKRAHPTHWMTGPEHHLLGTQHLALAAKVFLEAAVVQAPPVTSRVTSSFSHSVSVLAICAGATPCTRAGLQDGDVGRVLMKEGLDGWQAHVGIAAQAAFALDDTYSLTYACLLKSSSCKHSPPVKPAPISIA
jgi:hypothetical protein